MGTWTAFYVEGAREDDVAAACLEWLGAHCRIWAKLTGRKPRARSAEVPDDFWSWGSFRLRGGPDRVAIFSLSPGWVTVLFNAFLTPNTLAAAVSASCKTRVVDAQAQTTSDAYSIEVFEAGTSVRKLEFADSSWIQNQGAPLPKEPEPLESLPEDESEPGPGWFDADAAERYLELVFGIAWLRLPESGVRVTLIE